MSEGSLDAMLPSKLPTEHNHDVWLERYRQLGGGPLPDYLIRALVKIEPFAESSPPGVISYGLSHYGYDLRCGRKFKVFTPGPHYTVIDPKQLDARCFVDHEGDVCIIPPNSFALTVSVEHFEIPREITALVVDKSTWRRCGISMGATILEAEWQGRVTLEISNTTSLPVKIYAGEGLAQVVFFKGLRTCNVSYADKRGRYQNQTDITLPFVPPAP